MAILRTLRGPLSALDEAQRITRGVNPYTVRRENSSRIGYDRKLGRTALRANKYALARGIVRGSLKSSWQRQSTITRSYGSNKFRITKTASKRASTGRSSG